jgi:hypothetical protein
MKVTSLKNFVETGILLLLHIIKVDPLHQNNGLVLCGKHSAIPILMKVSQKPLIDALFHGLVVAGNLTLLHYIGQLNLVVVYHFLVCVNYRGPHLQCIIFIWSGRSGSPMWKM